MKSVKLLKIKAMLYRKIERYIEDYLTSGSDKILLLEGARQVGKSYIIRTVGQRLFRNYVELNFAEDKLGRGLFSNVRTTEEFYLILSMVAGNRLGDKHDTLIFLDGIQTYPQMLTMLKFLRQEGRYTYVASGSLLGLALKSTTSLPVGSIIRKTMHQLDFEEFMIANGVGGDVVDLMRKHWRTGEPLSEEVHERLMSLFRRYLLVGGMPDAVNEYLASHNIVRVREVQDSIRILYADDASKYEEDTNRNLVIRRIYEMIPSQMENKKKRIVAKDISGKTGDRFDRYREEFEYLTTSGIALGVHAISNPRYPLAESEEKNLIKLYLNDVGLLTSILYHINLTPILGDEASVNLGAVYESVVAQELRAHGHKLFYYDNRTRGEVDFLIDDAETCSAMPVEVKSGKDYTVHSAMDNLLAVPDYHIGRGVVLCNERVGSIKNGVWHRPIYYMMFLGEVDQANTDFNF